MRIEGFVAMLPDGGFSLASPLSHLFSYLSSHFAPRTSLLAFRSSLLALLSLSTCLQGMLHGAAYGPPHVYIGPEAILTLESASEHDVILNVINLGDSVLIFEPRNLVVTSQSGKNSIGQVIDKRETDTRGNTWKYSAKVLVTARTSEGFTVRGSFQDLKTVARVLIKFGGRRFYLEKVSQPEFDGLAQKIGDLSLQSTDFSKAFDRLQLPMMGKLRFPTGPETSEEDTRELISLEGVNSPKVIVRPPIQPTDSARKAGIKGEVKIIGVITRDGELLNAKVSKGMGYGLDERALEAVKNSWRFLPATKNGEVVETSVTLTVEFR